MPGNLDGKFFANEKRLQKLIMTINTMQPLKFFAISNIRNKIISQINSSLQ